MISEDTGTDQIAADIQAIIDAHVLDVAKKISIDLAIDDFQFGFDVGASLASKHAAALEIQLVRRGHGQKDDTTIERVDYHALIQSAIEDIDADDLAEKAPLALELADALEHLASNVRRWVSDIQEHGHVIGAPDLSSTGSQRKPR